jgi:hypothetical protein
MLFMTMESGTGRVVFEVHGLLNEGAIAGLLEQIALAPPEVGVVIDLSQAHLAAKEWRQLARGLSSRVGPVEFREPSREKGNPDRG